MKYTSAIATTASGSLGGLTASRNRGGQYLRRRAVPVNPSTSRQVSIRAIFATLVNNWTNLLTGVQRTAWATFAANTPQVDSLGNALILTGQQAYIKANTPRLQAALAAVNNAPTVFDNGIPAGIVQPGGFIYTNTPPVEYDVNSDFGGSVAPVAGSANLYVGIPQNASVNFYKGPYQFASTNTFTLAATAIQWLPVVGTDWSAVQVPVPGQFVPYRIRVLYEDGRTPNPTDGIVEVTT